MEGVCEGAEDEVQSVSATGGFFVVKERNPAEQMHTM